MLKQVLLLLSCFAAHAQVTKPVQVYSTSGQLQWPPSFFMTNVFASGGTTLSFDSLGRMTISSVAGSGTNSYYTTNGVFLGQVGTLNFTAGLTGYVSGAEIFIGNSVAGGGDVTTAQLLVVSNQMIAASNYSFTAIGVTSNKFQTDVSNLQGATNGLAAQILVVSNQGAFASNYFQGVTTAITNQFRNDITSISNITITASNKFQTDVSNLQGATNSFNTTNANLANHINNVATNTIKYLTNIWGDVARGFGGLVDGQVLTYKTASSTWTNQTPSAGSGSPGGNSGAVQFNEGGAFAGTNEFLYDRANAFLMVTGLSAGVQVRGIGSYLQIGAPTSSGTNRWDLQKLVVAMTAADPNFALSVGTALLSPINSWVVYTNRYVTLASNHADIGTTVLPFRNAYSDNTESRMSMRLGFTNGGSGTIFTNAGLFKPTNVFVFNITNPVAGQVLKFNSVTYAGEIATIALTNDTDSTGGGGGITTNGNQFGANTTLTIKDGVLLTNAFIYNYLTLSNSGTPATPLTNHLVVGKDSYAGRGLLESWDDNRLSIAYQPAFMNNRITMFQPSATTVIGSYGLTIPVNLGGVTVSHPAPTEEWPYMVQLATPATSNACAGTFSSIDMTTMGTRYGLNGYFFATEFLSTNLLVTNLQAPAGNRLFIGRTSTANPNLTNIVNTTNGTGQYAGLYCDSGNSAQFFLSVRDGTAEFRTNTGMFWRATNLYQFYMMQAPTSKFLAWKLKNLTSGSSQEGWFSNNVPTNMMKFGYLIRNGTTVVHSVRFSKVYVEAPLSP